jgi:ribosome maturation factor RimP
LVLPANQRTFAVARKSTEGNGAVPFFFWYMSNETAIQQIEQLIGQVLADTPEYFLVSVRIKPTNNVKVFLDGDNGITIEKCVQFNRKLYKLIEETGMYPEGEFSLEVSSPGIDEPLKMQRQYVNNTGRDIEVDFHDDTRKTGKLHAVTSADILLEHTEGKGKKAVTQQLLVPFENIKSTTVQIKF